MATNLVGRESETAAVLSLLQEPCLRLITITGAAGTGKTRLARRVAEEALTAYSDGVVPVSFLSNADVEVSRAIGRMLGIDAAGDEDLERALVTYLKDRRTLLLLDDLDPVPEAGRFAARTLSSCPGLN